MPTQSEVKTSLGERLQDFLKDVVTLDVLTLSGTISLEKAAPAAGAAGRKEVIQWENLFAEVTAGMQPGAANQLTVVAYTHAQWDCDSVNFVKEDPGDQDLHLIESHRKAVEAAQRSRFEALKFIGDAIRSI